MITKKSFNFKQHGTNQLKFVTKQVVKKPKDAKLNNLDENDKEN